MAEICVFKCDSADVCIWQVSTYSPGQTQSIQGLDLPLGLLLLVLSAVDAAPVSAGGLYCPLVDGGPQGLQILYLFEILLRDKFVPAVLQG